MRRPSSQISAVDSASDTQERTTSSSRAGGVADPQMRQDLDVRRLPDPVDHRVRRRSSRRAGPPRISAEKPGPCSSTKSKNRRMTRSSRAPSGPSCGSTNRAGQLVGGAPQRGLVQALFAGEVVVDQRPRDARGRGYLVDRDLVGRAVG